MKHLKNFVLKKLNKDNFDMVSKKDILNIISDLRSYGLNWEDHPEEVEQKIETHYPILKEFEKENETIDLLGENFKIPEIKNILNNSNKPMNYLIEGDNLHGLHSIRKVLRGKVDVIYIDPPYNTGNEFVYNDKKVGEDDSYKHSKWLSFMHKRLKIAKELLSENSFIFISIDDKEQAQLKLLCDKVFGEDNFINTRSWYKGYGKNDSSFFRNTTEYLLVYSKNKKYLDEKDIKFGCIKEGYEDIQAIREDYLKNNKNPNVDELQSLIRNYYKIHDYLKGIKSYNKVEKNTFNIYRGVTLEDPSGNNYIYDIIHPDTKKPCKIPNKGWNRPKSSMEKLIKNKEIIFKKDETFLPERKYYLKDKKYEIPKDLVKNSSQGGSELKRIFGESLFNFPKHSDVIKDFLSVLPKEYCKDSKYLDFFAGSGTLGQVVLELNEEDGGNRQWIMMTNNENMEKKKFLTLKIYEYFEELGLVKKFKNKLTDKGKIRNTFQTCFKNELGINLINNKPIMEMVKIKEYLENNKESISNKISMNKYKIWDFLESKGIVEKYNKNKWYKNDKNKTLKKYKEYVNKLCPFDVKNNKIVFKEKEKEIIKEFKSENFRLVLEKIQKVIESKGICHNVTYRRMKKIMNGYTDNNGNKVEGLGGNLTYLKTGFIKKSFDLDFQRKQLSKEVFNLVKIKENTILSNSYDKYKIFKNNIKIVGFYSGNLDYNILEEISCKLLKNKHKEKIIYTKYTPELEDKKFQELKIKGIEFKRIPESLLYL